MEGNQKRKQKPQNNRIQRTYKINEEENEGINKDKKREVGGVVAPPIENEKSGDHCRSLKEAGNN